MSHRVWRVLFAGTLLGVTILGIGGRLAMAGLAASTGTRPHVTLGGTLTVIGMGAASGLAGSAMALAARAIRRRLAPNTVWLEHALLALALLLVTMRGLHGTPPIARWVFFPLVAAYGVMLTLWILRDASRRRAQTSTIA